MAEEILASAKINEADIQGLEELNPQPLAPPPVITPSSNLLWPIVATEENFFDKALANGHVTDYINGDVGVDGATTLDSWEAGEPAGIDGTEEVEEGEGWDLDEDVEEPDAAHLNAAEDVVPEDEGDAAAAAPGVPEPELWARNSPFAADHAAAGQFESAMQVRGCIQPEELLSETIHSSSIARSARSISRPSNPSSSAYIVPLTSSSRRPHHYRRCSFTSVVILKCDYRF